MGASDASAARMRCWKRGSVAAQPAQRPMLARSCGHVPAARCRGPGATLHRPHAANCARCGSRSASAWCTVSGCCTARCGRTQSRRRCRRQRCTEEQLGDAELQQRRKVGRVVGEVGQVCEHLPPRLGARRSRCGPELCHQLCEEVAARLGGPCSELLASRRAPRWRRRHGRCDRCRRW